MTCSKIAQEQLHEKYVLGRLNEADKSKYEQHLDSCAACRSGLEIERLMVYGIRDRGKSDMKTEIQQQVKQLDSESSRFNWPMIARIAAVLLFTVLTPTVIYFYSRTAKTPLTQETVLQMKSKRDSTITQAAPPQSGPLPSRQEEESVMPSEQPLETPDEQGMAAGEHASAAPEPSGRKEGELDQPAMASGGQLSRLQVTDLPSEEGQIQQNLAEGRAPRGRVSSGQASSELSSERALRQAEESLYLVKKDTQADSTRAYRYVSSPEHQKSSGAFIDRVIRESSGPMTAAVHRFASGNRTITLYFLIDAEVKKPGEMAEFPVAVMHRDSLHIEIELLVDEGFARIDPQNCRLELIRDRVLRLLVGSGASYLVDLEAEQPKAVLQP